MKALHEYAKFFPPMEGEEFEALCNDIKQHGLLNPIVTYEGKTLDGRNRDKACDKVGIKPKYTEFTNGNAFEYVVSQNVLRRHLTPSQRAVLALELEKKFAAEEGTRKRGQRGPGKKDDTRTRASIRDRDNQPVTRAAKALHVGRASVETAKRLEKQAPHLIPAVRSGKVSLTDALVQHRNNRAEELARKDGERKKRDHLQKHNRQVGDYLESTKAYIVALKVAHVGAERFSKEAVMFVTRRHDEIRRLMKGLEDAIKA